MKKTKTKSTPKPPAAPASPVVARIVSADHLNRLLRQPMILRFGVGATPGLEGTGQIIELELERLTPAQEQQVTEVKQKLPPPPYEVIKQAGGQPVRDAKGEPLFDYNTENPDWKRKQSLCQRQQRSLRIYLGCPVVRQAVLARTPNGAPSLDEVHEFVEGLWTEMVLTLVDQALITHGLEVPERVNFTGGAGSGN